MDPHSIVTHVTSSVLMVMYNFDMYNDVTCMGKKIFWAINERRGEYRRWKFHLLDMPQHIRGPINSVPKIEGSLMLNLKTAFWAALVLFGPTMIRKWLSYSFKRSLTAKFPVANGLIKVLNVISSCLNLSSFSPSISNKSTLFCPLLTLSHKYTGTYW